VKEARFSVVTGQPAASRWPAALRPVAADRLAALVRSPAVAVFLATLAAYVALVPWMARAWQRSGDEPHYLLAAHSLVADGDLDLANNYAARDYAAFYSELYLDPHTRPSATGQALLTHNLGLSLLIAPAYGLGGLAGVLYFQALLGALLAANVYLLGFQLTHNSIAAAAGWLAVAAAPPVLWYVYLIYPEMPGALCLLLGLRPLLSGIEDELVSLGVLRRRQPQPRGSWVGRPARREAAASERQAADGMTDGPNKGAVLLVGLALGAMPWLSSRFLPLFGLLAGLALWRSWRESSRAWLMAGLLAGAGLAGYMLFTLALYGSASPAASYAGPIPLAVERSFAGLRVLRGVLGWLFDNQRGLLITGPIYLAALWGCGAMLRGRPMAGVVLLGLFAAALVPLAFWGGFWTGWEYSARFLVVVLPALGAGVAWLWAAGRRASVVPVTLLLFALSLASGRAVIEQPLRGLISSPIELLKPHVDLERYVPAMGRYAFIAAGREAAAGAPLPEGEPSGFTWETEAGQGGIVMRQVDLAEFPFGWYSGSLPLAAPEAEPDAAVARLRIFSPSGGEYYSQVIYGRDLDEAGAVPFTFRFHSPVYNGWAYPPTLILSATGQSRLRLGTLFIQPDRFRSLGLPALWLAGAVLLGAVVAGGAKQPRRQALSPHPAVTAGLALAAALSFGWSLLPQARTYHTADAQRTTGIVVRDSQAARGMAIEASEAAGQVAGRLAYTHPEIYAAGRYRLSVSLQLLGGEQGGGAKAAAVVRVVASDRDSLSERWEVAASDLQAGSYQRIGFELDNPRQQALTFFIEYTGRAALRADSLTVTPLR
jgi:hypothetical protein